MSSSNLVAPFNKLWCGSVKGENGSSLEPVNESSLAAMCFDRDEIQVTKQMLVDSANAPQVCGYMGSSSS